MGDNIWDRYNEQDEPFEDLDFGYLMQVEEVEVTHSGKSTDKTILLNVNQDSNDIQIWMPKKTIYGQCSGISSWAVGNFYEKIRIANEEITSDFEGM